MQKEIDPRVLPLVAIVEQGGGTWVGIQEGLGDSLVLFQAPSRTTLAIPLLSLTPQLVFQKILESSARFTPKAFGVAA